MAFSIPDAKRAQMKQQATAAGMPYATVVGQHVYDLQGLVDVLSAELQQAHQAGNGAQTAEVQRKLTARQAELAAYRQEQTSAGGA